MICFHRTIFACDKANSIASDLVEGGGYIRFIGSNTLFLSLWRLSDLGGGSTYRYPFLTISSVWQNCFWAYAAKPSLLCPPCSHTFGNSSRTEKQSSYARCSSLERHTGTYSDVPCIAAIFGIPSPSYKRKILLVISCPLSSQQEDGSFFPEG